MSTSSTPCFLAPVFFRGFLLLIVLGQIPGKGQIVLVASTLDAGGGTSSGGGYSLSGTIGQPDAAAPLEAESWSLGGGFWKRFRKVLQGGFAAWAAEHLPAGRDLSFEGDADGDGLPNGLHYVFGDAGVRVTAAKYITAPPQPVPQDVHLVLRRSTDLMAWEDVLEYADGLQVFRFSILEPSADGSFLTDRSGDPGAFYTYEATHTP